MGDFYDDLDKYDDVLGRLQLYSKGLFCDKRIIRAGHYGIPESHLEITDLGAKVDILPLARRPKAIDMSNTESLIVSHDPESADFKRMVVKSLKKESDCMYGVSFLVYENRSGRFLEFFCGSRSSRSEAKKIYPSLPLTAVEIEARQLDGAEKHGPIALTLNSKLVKKGKFSWHVPQVAKCARQITPPASELIDRQIERFVSVLV